MRSWRALSRIPGRTDLQWTHYAPEGRFEDVGRALDET